MVSAQQSPSLRRSTIDLLGAQVLRNLAPILLLLLLARFTDQETVGRFSLMLAIATPFFVFAQLGLRTVSLTLNPDVRFGSYARTQTAAVSIAIAVVAATTAIGNPGLLGGMLCLALLKTADVFSDFLSGPLQRRHRSRTILVASIVYAVAASAAAAITLTFSGDLVPTILVVAVASLLAMYLFLFLPASRVARSETSAPVRPALRIEIRRILAAGVPLGLTTAILSLISTFPQYIVTASHGADETARFAVILYVYALADLVTGTISQAWIPTAQYQLSHGEGNKTLVLAVRNAAKWTLVYIPIVVIGLIATAQLFPLIFKGDYTLSFAEAVPLGLAILALPLAHFTAIAVAIENYYAHSLILAIFSAGVAILGCIALIPSLGLTGAFIALFASVVTRALIAAGILLWFLRTPVKGGDS